MHRLYAIKNCFIECVEKHLCDLDAIDTKELGEVVDMIKDLEEAIYYATIVESMKESSGEVMETHSKGHVPHTTEHMTHESRV